MSKQHEPVGILDEKESESHILSIREDGIARIRIKENIEVDVIHVREIVNALEILGNRKKFPLLILSSEYTLPTADARTYIASAASNPYASAEAYMIRSLPQKLVGNVYLSFNKPARPTRLFTEEAKAVEWLRTFL
ncbi:MAG: hypothetical protein K0Q95_2478 [Bacteroidota bacterium]|jgi:hypothetical protein|nr:hypothetical protein [Bacteroidota bacterium]